MMDIETRARDLAEKLFVPIASKQDWIFKSIKSALQSVRDEVIEEIAKHIEETYYPFEETYYLLGEELQIAQNIRALKERKDHE